MKKFFAIILITLIFASCQDVVQIKLDKGSKLLVVDAFVSNLRTAQKIRLTYTDDYFSNQNPPPAAGASVVLKDLTNNLTYNFTDQNNGDYIFNLASTDTIGHVGHTYKLEVTFSGNLYTSIVDEKRPAKFDSISATYHNGSSVFAPKPGYYCVLWARDPPGPISDYYWIRSSKNGTPYSQASDINLAIDGTGGSVPSTDTLLFTPPAINQIIPRREVLNVGDTCAVEIHSINKETYFFLTQVINQTNNSGLFATTPENVRTNIISPEGATKAIGWFSVSSVSAGGKKIK
ncbi:MAG TPA: DUF4249 domain-containing protein [Bacteroidia bacterium]|jgi:hypothetical protein|nr:DUF4249 domain-containing protein [Bacteroidia bacterium]